MKTAIEFIDQAKANGYKVELEGNWIKWTPPLPVEMLMEAMDHTDEITEILKGNNHE